jgi:sigma-70-like protein
VDDDRERFTALYDAYRMRMWAYAASRVGGQAADEVVSKTFMVAWRRFGEMPSAALPWLLGVARNVIRDSVRAQTRRDSLAAELRRWTTEAESDVADGVVDRIAMLRALAALSDGDREVLGVERPLHPLRDDGGELEAGHQPLEGRKVLRAGHRRRVDGGPGAAPSDGSRQAHEDVPAGGPQPRTGENGSRHGEVAQRSRACPPERQ